MSTKSDVTPMRSNSYVEKLDSIKEIFSDSFREKIEETITLFEENMEYIEIALVKCCVVGNVTTGKSTLVNALLKEDILYEGKSKGTLCAARCQLTQNKEEYFKIYEGNIYLDKCFTIKQIKDINYKNPDYSKFSMNTNNHLSIHLNASKYDILQNFILIDCPGYNDDNLDAISKYCKYADLIVFCFRAEDGVTDKDIDKINEIRTKIGKFQISFIINRCDECKSIDRSKITHKLFPHLTENDAIFFISALEERKGLFNDERHREFERFNECLQKQKSQATITYRKVYLDLICSVKNLSEFLNFGTNRNNGFSDELFVELQKQIIQLINCNKTKYCKEDITSAFLDYSNQANTEISKFMVKQLNKDYKLKDGIINNIYFFKRFIENDAISKPTFSQHQWGDKSETLKHSFVDYFNENSTKMKKSVDKHYKERAKTCIEDLVNYKNELQNITNSINELVIE